ncbi:MAG TPA: Ig-like domain-containing protein [Polyangiaceae bacterium]|nr:Ig-like domain-containing protein [Polyangiaceae bacterium]
MLWGGLLAIAALTSGCDLGPRDEAAAHGPPLHLVASYPADGQGTNAPFGADVSCDSPTPDCAVPTNVAIELRFDRFLRPGGLNAAFALYSGNPPANGVPLQAEYDMIERVVVYRPLRQLQPNTLYTALLVSGTDLGQGFWAFDGAPLEEGPVRLRFSFGTGSGPRPVPPPVASPVDTCETMTQGPLDSCVSCHSTPPPDAHNAPSTRLPPMGLDLSSERGLFYTAIRQVAHQTETGNSATGEGLQSPARFGVQMNIVDPGSPATSYLMYKLLRKSESFAVSGDAPSCVTGYHSPVSDLDCQPPPEDERVRLREWFVLGDPMPKDGTSSTGEPIPVATTRENLVRISAWIATGAECPAPP